MCGRLVGKADFGLSHSDSRGSVSDTPPTGIVHSLGTYPELRNGEQLKGKRYGKRYSGVRSEELWRGSCTLGVI